MEKILLIICIAFIVIYLILVFHYEKRLKAKDKHIGALKNTLDKFPTNKLDRNGIEIQLGDMCIIYAYIDNPGTSVVTVDDDSKIKCIDGTFTYELHYWGAEAKNLPLNVIKSELIEVIKEGLEK